MPAVPDSVYFENRMQECMMAAERATDTAVACVHRQFVANYRVAARKAKLSESAQDLVDPRQIAAKLPVGNTADGQ